MAVVVDLTSNSLWKKRNVGREEVEDDEQHSDRLVTTWSEENVHKLMKLGENIDMINTKKETEIQILHELNITKAYERFLQFLQIRLQVDRDVHYLLPFFDI